MNYSKKSEPADIGSFYTQIGRLKRLYTSLTNDDLNYEERRKGELIQNLAIKLSVSEKEIKGVMDKSILTLG
ncbi:hypothetical protein N9545_09320 [Salibacteraceae bacterium]|nr:hypothetical protein [Salibacteraceae bacterium]